MSNKLVNDMLSNMGDPKLQRMYGAIISGDIVKQVRCLSDTCQGRVIATIDKIGTVNETAPVFTKKGRLTSGLEGSRRRFDGQMGFRCFCGNESILSEEERGVITGIKPTADDLETVAERLSKRKIELYPQVNGEQIVDGFIIEDPK